MSLLDRKAPHVVWVQNRETGRNAEGQRVMLPVGMPVRVTCKVEPVRDWSSAEENQFHGLQMNDLRVIYSRAWPGNVHSHVLWDGTVFETVGEPQSFKASRRTRHFRTTVKWIGAPDSESWPNPVAP